MENLENAATSWIEAAFEQKQAARFAERDNVSLNQFFIGAIAARVGAEDFCERLIQRMESRGKFGLPALIRMLATKLRRSRHSVLQLVAGPRHKRLLSMADTQQILFLHKDIAEMLIKRQGLHEGCWGICLEFGISVGSVEFPPQSGNANPGATLTVSKIGIQRSDVPNPLAVNAADVNPQRASGDEGKRTGDKSAARREPKNKQRSA